MQSQHTPKAHLWIVSHDVVESGQQTQAGGNLWVHGTVDIVEQVERLADEFVAFPQQPLLDLALATGEKVERVCCLPGEKKKTPTLVINTTLCILFTKLCVLCTSSQLAALAAPKGEKTCRKPCVLQACMHVKNSQHQKNCGPGKSVRMSLMLVISLAQQCNLVKASFFLGI